MIAKLIYKEFRTRYKSEDDSFYMYMDGRIDYDYLGLSPYSSVGYIAGGAGYRFARCTRYDRRI